MAPPAKDLAPLPPELLDDERWLQALSALDARTFRIGLDDDRIEDQLPRIVERGPDGGWWAGRFIGSLTLDGRRLVIEPRLGIEVVEPWLDEAFGLIAPPRSARHTDSETFLVRLLARLWCRAVDQATRHGLPLLRLDVGHAGEYVRGRLDVRGTIALRARGHDAVASVTRERSLDHPATRAIVCAERALSDRLIAHGEWRPERVRQITSALRASVGTRPRLPTLSQLHRVRYTPITMRFRNLALLSHRIASRLGYGVAEESGAAEGLLIDVAELWELFLLGCLRPTGLSVEHGTTAGEPVHLLRSADGERGLGRLKPDLIVRDQYGVAAILDAKYKRLAWAPERPSGVDTADLYQLAAYATRLRPRLAALLYPEAPRDPSDRAAAERTGGWRLDDAEVHFRRIPTDRQGCRQALLDLIANIAELPVGTRAA